MRVIDTYPLTLHVPAGTVNVTTNWHTSCTHCIAHSHHHVWIYLQYAQSACPDTHIEINIVTAKGQCHAADWMTNRTVMLGLTEGRFAQIWSVCVPFGN